MSALSNMATPPEIPVEAPHGSPSSRSASATSSASLARWRNAHERTYEAQASPGESITAFDKPRSAEGRASRVPQVGFAEPQEQRPPSPTHASPQDPPTGASPLRSTSIDERSYRAAASDQVRRSSSYSHLAADTETAAAAAAATTHDQRRSHPLHRVVGDEPVRWSFSSASPNASQHLADTRAAPSSPSAIAAAVPAIAHGRDAAATAYAGRWTEKVQRSTVEEEETVRAYRQLESALREAERRITTAEERQQREMGMLRAELQKEREGRLKAEQDREELLNQATISPALSPRGSALAGHNVVHVSAEGGNRSRSSVSGVASAAAAGSAAEGAKSTTAGPTTTYISEAFYDKMKEREERARARVRKEFVRQAQENVYAEQKKTAEAEKAAALAVRRLQKAEEELRIAQDALQESTSVMEAKDVQLHERAIHIQELEAQLRLLQRQLESAGKASEQAEQQARRKLEEAQRLADMRQAELEAQRGFAQQLQEQLGLKTRDLFDQEASQDSVLKLVAGLQTRCATLETELETAVREATALLEQRRQHAEDEAGLLRQRSEELKKRCSAAEAEVASMKGQRECDAAEIALLRQRYEKDLSDQRVETRSLQLQLERVLDAARRNSSENISDKEIERQQQAALVRKYAAETKAAREELDRARAASQRENEKHLYTILELSQQLTALKQANTRLEHTANIHEHESADATRLLTRARDELSQLREERRHLSRSIVEFREDSRMRSVTDGPDVWQRRAAELENVRRDLHEKLLQANQTIEDLQQRSQYVMNQSSRLSQHEHKCMTLQEDARSSGLPVRQVLHPHLENHHAAQEVVEATGKARCPSRASVASTTASLGLPELLESMVDQLEPIIHPTSQHRHESSVKAIPSTSASSTDPLTLRERRLQKSLSPEERAALDRVLVSCTAALQCQAKTQHVVDSPLKSFVEEEAEARECTPTPHSLNPVVRPSPLPTCELLGMATRDEAATHRSTSSGVCVDQPLQHTAVSKTEVPSPHGPPARPRRSSQPSLSSVAADDLRVRFSHTFERPVASRPNERVTPIEASLRNSTQDAALKEHAEVPRMKNDASISTDSRAAEAKNRDELEAEPCWDSHESDSVRYSSLDEVNRATPSLPQDEVHPLSRRAAPLRDIAKPSTATSALPSRPQRSGASPAASSVAGPSRAASAAQSIRDDSLVKALPASRSAHGAGAERSLGGGVEVGQHDGILRFSRIPEEALSPVPKMTSRDVSVVTSAAAEEAETGLFSNVQYAPSSVASLPQAPQQQQPQQQHSTTMPAMQGVNRQRAAVPGDALVIDVRRSTPPPARRRGHAY